MKTHPLTPFLFPLIFFFGLIFPDPSFAQNKKKSIEDTPKGSIVIVSQSLEFDNDKKVVVFKGDVNAKKDDFVIDCEKMVVFYQSNPPKKRDTKDLNTQIEKLIATGAVRIKRTDEGTASADRAEYYPGEEKIVLTGKPTVKQGNNVIEGDAITIFLEENRSIVESSKEKKVRAVIFPKDEKRERL